MAADLSEEVEVSHRRARGIVLLFITAQIANGFAIALIRHPSALFVAPIAIVLNVIVFPWVAGTVRNLNYIAATTRFSPGQILSGFGGGRLQIRFTLETLGALLAPPWWRRIFESAGWSARVLGPAIVLFAVADVAVVVQYYSTL